MNLMNSKSQKSIIRKPVSFIAPGQLAKERGYAQNTSNAAYGSKRIAVGEQKKDDVCNHGMTGENPVHNLFVHFGEDKWEERNITEDCSFLDVLSICNRFIDIYSIGIKITNAEGKPLRNDKDLLGLFKEQENVKNISIYLDKDTTMKPLEFKLPQDNTSFVSVSRASQMGDVLTDDSDDSAMNYHNTERNGEGSTGRKVIKGRGANKNKKLVALKQGEKLEIQFSTIVQSDQIINIGPDTWGKLCGTSMHVLDECIHGRRSLIVIKKIMWDMEKEKFSNPSMEVYKKDTLEHMDNLWTSWRSTLNKKYVEPCKTKALALKNVPLGMDAKDWEWLVTEKFLSEKFQDTSSRNAMNQAKGVMHHRSGCQPHRQIIYEMDEIVKAVQGNELLSPITFVDTCFGPQNHSKVFGFGGGMKRKYFNDPRTAYIEQLEAKLHEKEEECSDLRRRVEGIEGMLTRMVN